MFNLQSVPARSQRATWLFVVPWRLHHAGGVNRVVIDLYRACERSGEFAPLILVPDWNCSVPRYELYQGCRVVYLRVRPLGLSPVELLKWLAAAPVEYLRLARLLVKERVRIVNWHYPTEAAYAFALLRQLGAYKGDLVLSFHGLDLGNINFKGRLGTSWRAIVRATKAVTACSHSLRRDVETALDGLSRVSTVHNGIDVEDTLRESGEPLPAELSGIGPYIINAATYEPKKGQDILLRAFHAISVEHPDVSLVLMGRDGGTLASLTALSAELGISDRVRILPPQAHAQAMSACRHAQIFVLPSRAEPFGVVVLEAAVVGTAVVARRVGGVKEIMTGTDCGALVESEDPEELAGALREMLANDELRARRAAALRERVAKDFSLAASWASLQSAALGY